MRFKPCLPDSSLALLPTELQDFLLGVIISSPQPLLICSLVKIPNHQQTITFCSTIQKITTNSSNTANQKLPLTCRSDYHLNSPYIINPESRTNVMRIIKMITN